MNSKTEWVLNFDEAVRLWTPRELRDAVLDEFERSGISATQFAARLGVKYPPFASWVQQGRKPRRDSKSLQWVEALCSRHVNIAAFHRKIEKSG